MERGGEQVAGAAQVLGDEHVVEHGLCLPQADVLERAGHATGRDLIRGGGKDMVGKGVLVPLLLRFFPRFQRLVVQSLLRGKLGGIHGGVFALIGLFHLAGGMVAHDALAVEADAAVGGGVHAGDDVERGGLTRAVGSDEGHDLALVDLQTQVIHGDHAAELHGDILNRQNVLAHLDATSFALSFFRKSFPKKLMMASQENSLSPMMPLRKNSTTIIMTTENTSIRKPPRMNGMFTPR